MKNFSINLLLIIPILCLSVFFANEANAQEADTLITSSVEVRGDVEVEEITGADFINDLEAQFEAPSYKTDELGERGAARYVKFDNYTEWYIQCYVNGVFQGTMAPWGSLTIYLPRSETYRFFALAEFRDAPTKTWGGINRYVSGQFDWRLHR